MLKIISASYLIALILLSLIPLSGISPPGNSDKIAHFIAYCGLAVFVYFIARSFNMRLYLFLSVIALGILLEGLQIVIPGRSFSYFDILANALGAVFGFGLSLMFLASKETPSFGGCGSPQTTVPVKHSDEAERG